MATTVTRQSNLQLLNTMFGRKTSKSKYKGFSTQPIFNLLNFKGTGDTFFSSAANDLLSSIVKKMQQAISQPVPGMGSGSAGGSAINISMRVNGQTIRLDQEAAKPTQAQIEVGIANAGGMAALKPWVIDGKTKLDIDGRKVVVEVGSSGAEQSSADLTARQQAEKSIARFGLSADKLDGDLNKLKEELRAEQSRLSQNNPHLSGAIEYALEDAFTKIQSYQADQSGAAAPMDEAAYQAQRKKNLSQADSIVSQLGLGDGQDWGIQSLAEDLAVFGMDMTAMARDPGALAEEIRTKSKDMLNALGERYVGTEDEFIAQRNRITGASARLINGLEGSGGVFGALSMASANVSASVTVKVDGVSLNASSIVAMGNIIVDPLVLDLNGDGIDLKSAGEGVDFDMNGDGEKTAMGFIRGDDALLFVDEYGDGVVRDGRQLFGNVDGYANGFEKLKSYDSNNDGVIDENDDIWDQLKVWVEKTEDGVCDASETVSLADAGIKSISLGYENTREDDGKGNLIGQKGSFTRTDGTSGMAADVWLQERQKGNV